MKYLRVKNWTDHQHYKGRTDIKRMTWIKFYIKTLDDYAFAQMSDAAKWHFCGLLLLAGVTKNLIPYDLAWITSKLQAKSPVDVESLVMSGFVEVVDATSEALETLYTNSRKTLCQKEKENKSKKESIPRAKKAREAAAPNWVARASEVWSREIGIVPPPRLGKALKPAVDAHGLDAVLAGIPRYAAATEGRARNPEWFVADIVRYVAPAAVAVPELDSRGWMSADLDRATAVLGNGKGRP